MKLVVNLGLIPENLTTLEFLILAFHGHISPDELNITDESLEKLTEEGYIKIINSEKGEYDLRAKALEFKVEELKEKGNKESVDLTWIDEYRKLFREKSFSRGIMGSRSQCIQKMTAFIKKHKANKEDILGATKLYLDTINNPTYIQQADYFISKNGGSRLEAFLEEYKETGNKDTFYESI